MTAKITKNLYRIPIALPGNPLKELNAYYISGGSGRSLLIDTGFNNPQCLSAITAAFDELGVSPESTDVFITHLHSDHSGNAAALQNMGCRIIMGRRDYEKLCAEDWSAMRQRALCEGMSGKVIEDVFGSNPATLYAPDPFTAVTVNDGDVLRYGGFELDCLMTPGHTPGHMCLYDKAHGILFSGDHILFDISPNITFWNGVPDSLGDYLNSLEIISALPAEIVLPGHKGCGGQTLRQRAEGLLSHHERRLNELLGVIENCGGLTAYELTGRLRWRIHAASWEEFPPAQKWFAMGEALAHLDHLLALGVLRRNEDPQTSLRTYFKNN